MVLSHEGEVGKLQLKKKHYINNQEMGCHYSWQVYKMSFRLPGDKTDDTDFIFLIIDLASSLPDPSALYFFIF